MFYQKTANIVAIFPTSRLVTFSRLVTHFCCGHNVRRFARGDCIKKLMFVKMEDSKPI